MNVSFRKLFQSHRSLLWIAGFILLCSVALRCYHLDVQSLWGDELATWQDCWQPSFAKFWATYQKYELTPPLYFLLEFGLAQLVPATETSLRILSVISGLGFVSACGLFGAQLSRDRAEKVWAAFASGAFAAFSFRAVLMSREARCYSLLFLLAALSGWAWLRIEWRADRWSKVRALPYILIAALLSYTHYFGVLLVVAQALSLFFVLPIRELRCWARAVAIYALTLLFYSPWLIYLVYHSPVVPTQVWPIPSLDKFFVAHRELFGSSSVSAIFALLLTAIAFSRLKGEARRRSIAVFSWVILVFVLAAVVSVVRPIYSERYYMLVLGPALVVAAVGAATLRPWPKVVTGAIVLFCLLGLHETVFARQIYSRPQNEQIRQATFAAVEELRESPEAGLGVVAFSPFVTDFYMQKAGSSRRFFAQGIETREDLLDPDKWPEQLRGPHDLIALVFTYDDGDFDRLFSKNVVGYRLVSRRDFHHVAVVRLIKTP